MSTIAHRSNKLTMATTNLTPHPERLADSLGALQPLLDSLQQNARSALLEHVTTPGTSDTGEANKRISGKALESKQFAAHAFAWLGTYVESIRQLGQWNARLIDSGSNDELDRLILMLATSEYLCQIIGGISMSQGEIARLTDVGLSSEAISSFAANPVVTALTDLDREALRSAIAKELVARAGATTYGNCALDSEFDLIRDQFFRFSNEKIKPDAHGWHLEDKLIPMDVVQAMNELGVFGLTIPEAYGGLGMGKTAMCVVSEELSRGYIGVGSLGTRSEIAAELILGGGTDAQKTHWLPGLASGDIMPTAVFTEPGTGSDLGSITTRAERSGDMWQVTGNKTWITHGARTDMMTLLARTDPSTSNYSGLSMFLAAKPRGTDADPFPASGMSGGEIEVLGYRGMKEYEIGFDGFEVSADQLLGDIEGQGFRQLMQTFESARIQTAARAIGVAQNALDVSLAYATERRQFGKALVEFPRVSGKLANMATEIMIARQLTYFSATEKDADRRCDLEAGLAKLLAARVAWSCADNGVQIHGGNGFALEYPISRILCDARILNIFEGAAEIQAQVIARRLLEADS